MSSYSDDVYPNTPTFTFVKAKYKSKYVAFKSVEQYANYSTAKTNYYATLQKPTAQEIALVTKYDTPKYIKGLPANPPDPIPFMTFANKFLVAGASYSPPRSPARRARRSRRRLTTPRVPSPTPSSLRRTIRPPRSARLTKQQPSNVCSSQAVMAAEKAMNK